MAFFQRTLAKFSGVKHPEHPPSVTGANSAEEAASLSLKETQNDEEISGVIGVRKINDTSCAVPMVNSPGVESVARLPVNRPNRSSSPNSNGSDDTLIELMKKGKHNDENDDEESVAVFHLRDINVINSPNLKHQSHNKRQKSTSTSKKKKRKRILGMPAVSKSRPSPQAQHMHRTQQKYCVRPTIPT